jgi:hypothetical protein
MSNEEFKNLIANSKNINDKICLMTIYSKIVYAFNDKVFDAIDLEKKLVKDLNFIVEDISPAIKKCENILHIISTPYFTGGHTRLCEKMSTMTKVSSNLLITKKHDVGLIDRLSKFFENIYYEKEFDILKKIKWYISIIKVYKTIVLHIDSDDILLVLAVGLVKEIDVELNVIFVNHADHLFSFGKSLPNVMLQISNFGYEVDKHVEGKDYINSFIGIPVSINNSLVNRVFDLSKDNIHFLMAGDSYKMRPSNFGSSPELINQILSQNKTFKFTVIGVKKTDWWWYYLRFKYLHRLKTLNRLPYDEYLQLIHDADVCVDTSPIIGGTAFVEMYLKGLYPLGISSAINGYTPLDAVKTQSYFSINLLANNYESLFHEIYNVHDIRCVQKRFNDVLNNNFHPLPDVLGQHCNNIDVVFANRKKPTISLTLLLAFLKVDEISLFWKLRLLLKEFNLFKSLLKTLFQRN